MPLCGSKYLCGGYTFCRCGGGGGIGIPLDWWGRRKALLRSAVRLGSYHHTTHHCLMCRMRSMQGMRETQLTAEVELLPTESSKAKQAPRPPISMNFEVRTGVGVGEGWDSLSLQLSL